MNKKELDEYCKSLGLVKHNHLGDLWYCYTYPFKYKRPNDVLVGFKVSFQEFQGKELNETIVRRIRLTQKIMLGEDGDCIACCGFSDVGEDCKDDEIKQKIYNLVKKYEEVIGDYKKYRVKSKVKEIEGDFE